MDYPNAFHGGMGLSPNFRAPFPNVRMNEQQQFDLRGIAGGFGPSVDEQLRRLALIREAEIRARLEFRDSNVQPLPPGLDPNLGLYQDRDRKREREKEIRNREDRDNGRDRDRWRNDYEDDRGRTSSHDKNRARGSDYDQDRDGGGSSRSDRHRDRSPISDADSDTRTSKYSSNDNDLYSDDDRNNSDRNRNNRISDLQADVNRFMEERGGDKWVSNQPSRTIILRGLHLSIDEKMIASELMLLRLPVKDIRLIKRSTGVSRGFAFVEFHNVADAQRWMEHAQGTFVLLNQYKASMAYSDSRDRNGNNRDLQRNDWVCGKCLTHNFKRRDFCYNCNLPRKEAEKGRTYDGLDEIGTNPCNTLILRGLDALTTEEALVTALTQAFAPTQLVPIKNIVVIRDELGSSRGFGFVEFYSVAASTLVLESLKYLNPPLEVDGKQLLINFAKNTFNTTMAYLQQKSQSQLYGQGASGMGHTGVTAIAGDHSANSAAAVALAAIKQAQAAKHYQQQLEKQNASAIQGKVTVNGVEYPVYPPPDTSTYQYEETSGYYYDPLTHLYYDANSQYYYNSTSGQYMYWDSERSTYLPAPDTPAEGSQVYQNKQEDKVDKEDKDEREDKEEKKDKEKVKTAKKIVKDMERWAKSMNAQKDAQKEVVKKSPNQSSGSKQESAAADAGFAMLQRMKDDINLMPPPPIQKSEKAGTSTSKPGLVASYGGDSDDSADDDDAPSPVVDESKFVDWAKLTCLLCKRQFQSKDILNKHIQVSDLHKQNLEALLKSKGRSTGSVEYRDRAKERRQKYGVPEPPEPAKNKDRGYEPAEMYVDSVNVGIGGDNIGNKLLQKMGWSEGQGLGKSNQGRIDPIKAQQRNQMAGLGSKGANIVAEAKDDYRVALKKTLFARYNEVD